MLLAIDTSTAWSGLALFDGTQVLAEVTWRSARHHTEQVLAQLDLLMQHVGHAPADLTALAIATGPGSWAGLRVGMTTAKALAVAHGLPLIAVTTPEVWVWPHRARVEPVVVAIQLGRNRYAVSAFEVVGQPCAEPDVAQVYSLDDVPVREAFYLGDLDAALVARVAGPGRVATPADNVRRPAALAEIAWDRWQRGEVANLVGLEPIYLSHPVQ